MQSNFNRSLLLLLQHEGNFVNHPSDPGGMTNLGVTAKVWESWVGHPVDEKQMRALTPDDVAPLYKRKYWDACRADEFVSGLDYAVFDCAVNSGVGRAVKLLQGCVGVVADGGIGPATMAAVNQAVPTSLIEDFCDARLNFLRALNTWPTFGRGWERRVNEVKEEALRMLG
jgi:lysozyme family protein